MMLRGHSCELVITDAQDTTYMYTVRLDPGEKIQMNDVFISLIQTRFIKWTHDQLGTLSLFKPYPRNFSVTLCNVWFYNGFKTDCTQPSDDCVDSQNQRQYFAFKIDIRVSGLHNFDNFYKFTSVLKTRTFDMLIIINELTYRYYSFRISEISHGFSLKWEKAQLLNYITGYNDTCTEHVESLNLAQHKSCPMVALKASEHEFKIDESTLNLPAMNLKLTTSEYHFDDKGSMVYICADSYIKPNNLISQIRNLSSANTEHIISLVFVSLSIICLLFSLAIYMIIPTLRTIPGKNNMALISSLMVAQALFLISSYGSFKQRSVICKAVGLLTHFFWLMSAFWMGVCTVHVFWKFSNLARLVSVDGWKIFMVYICFTLASSVVFVLANILGSSYTQAINDFGYGKYSCYITSATMIGYTFALPLGFVIVTNIIVFVIFIWKMKKLPDLKKDVRHERNDILIFAKLSTLTGITWVFGYIYTWTRIMVFSYLFIVLNASQGIFLCFSFVINRRVLYLLKDKFGSFKTSERELQGFSQKWALYPIWCIAFAFSVLTFTAYHICPNIWESIFTTFWYVQNLGLYEWQTV